MEVWSSLMAEQDIRSSDDCTVGGLKSRLSHAEIALRTIARDIADRNAWDSTWTDYLDKPAQTKTYGSSIAHIITHSMHHRAQILYMLRMSGVESVPEGDVFSWENSTGP
jgi:uncharacterized damage-inducible protein DinB